MLFAGRQDSRSLRVCPRITILVSRLALCHEGHGFCNKCVQQADHREMHDASAIHCVCDLCYQQDHRDELGIAWWSAGAEAKLGIRFIETRDPAEMPLRGGFLRRVHRPFGGAYELEMIPAKGALYELFWDLECLSALWRAICVEKRQHSATRCDGHPERRELLRGNCTMPVPTERAVCHW
jgi:hypothetical protein